MPDLVLLGTAERVEEFEPDENPADSFVMLFCGPIDREARAQLYAMVIGMLSDDAMALESMVRMMSDEGPTFYELDPSIRDAIGRLDEYQVEQMAFDWSETEPVESANVDPSDLTDFLFHFVHLCQTAGNDDVDIFFLSDS